MFSREVLSIHYNSFTGKSSITKYLLEDACVFKRNVYYFINSYTFAKVNTYLENKIAPSDRISFHGVPISQRSTIFCGVEKPTCHHIT